MKWSCLYLMIVLCIACDTQEESATDCSTDLIDISTVENMELIDRSPISVIDAEQDGTNISVNLSIGGCEEDQVVRAAYAIEAILADPPIVSVNLFVDEIQECEAIFTIERCFDFASFQEDNNLSFYTLDFVGSNVSLLIND